MNSQQSGIRKLVIIVGVLTFFLTACATDGKNPLFLTSDEVCSLIPQELGEEILGTPFNTVPKTNLESEQAASCQFISTVDEEYFTKNFLVAIRSTDDREQIKKDFDSAVEIWANNAISNRTSQNPTNIGTEAYWTYSTAVPQLITYQENRLLIITLGQLDEDEDTQLEKATKLANFVFGEIVGPTNE